MLQPLRGGTLILDSQLLITAPVGKYDVSENPAVRMCIGAEVE